MSIPQKSELALAVQGATGGQLFVRAVAYGGPLNGKPVNIPKGCTQWPAWGRSGRVVYDVHTALDGEQGTQTAYLALVPAGAALPDVQQVVRDGERHGTGRPHEG